MKQYKAYFNLTHDINPEDVEIANDYLDDDMTKYLIEDLKKKMPETAPKIVEILWSLNNVNSGVVTVTSERLDKKEKEWISNWISGQCSDGLGEGFENQDFASTANGVSGFDWQSNDYTLY